jgi:hypothetical protein
VLVEYQKKKNKEKKIKYLVNNRRRNCSCTRSSMISIMFFLSDMFIFLRTHHDFGIFAKRRKYRIEIKGKRIMKVE